MDDRRRTGRRSTTWSPCSGPMATSTGTDEYSAFGGFEPYNAVCPLRRRPCPRPPPPARLDGVSPTVRPAAAVAAGTTVPVTLVIDHGPGAGDVRMCRVDTESGSTLAEVLADAEANSTPVPRVTEFTTHGDGLASLNGVAETPEYGWSTRVDGAPSSGPIGFGDLVFAKFAATVVDPGPAPAVEVPALKPGPEPKW